MPALKSAIISFILIASCCYAAEVPYKDCGNADKAITVTSLELNPYPVQAGKEVAVTFTIQLTGCIPDNTDMFITLDMTYRNVTGDYNVYANCSNYPPACVKFCEGIDKICNCEKCDGVSFLESFLMIFGINPYSCGKCPLCCCPCKSCCYKITKRFLIHSIPDGFQLIKTDVTFRFVDPGKKELGCFSFSPEVVNQ